MNFNRGYRLFAFGIIGGRCRGVIPAGRFFASWNNWLLNLTPKAN